jgi:hypothetical protein
LLTSLPLAATGTGREQKCCEHSWNSSPMVYSPE